MQVPVAEASPPADPGEPVRHVVRIQRPRHLESATPRATLIRWSIRSASTPTRPRSAPAAPPAPRYRVTERIRVAHVAPSQAPTRLPASKLTTTGQCGDTCDQGTDTSRAGNADNTTIRLMALFMITAANAAMPNTPISNGRRNSAPPRPIRPPSTPTAAPAKNAHGIDRSRPTGTRRQHRSKYAHWLASSHDPDSRSSVVMDRAPSGPSAHPASAPPRTATNTAKASDNGTSLGTSADKA
jgi:hypothetical protein